MGQKIFLVILIALLASVTVIYAQDEITPISLEVRIYPDGSTLITYYLESDPTKVRVDVEVFGDSISNLIIRDENEVPLVSTATDSELTIDTIGASELTLVYSTSDLTTKEGPLWNFNITTPISTRIILPQGAAIFDLSDIPNDLGSLDGAQYLVMPAGETYVSFILALPNLDAEAQEAIDEADSYLDALETQGYVLVDAREELTQAGILYESDQFIEAKTTAQHAILTADEAVEDAKSAATEIALTTSVIEIAQEDGRTLGLSQAQGTLSSAETYYSQGLYIEAETAAKQAAQIALTAERPTGGNTMLYIGFIVLVAAAAGGYYYTQNMRGQEPQRAQYQPEPQEKLVLLEKIFTEHRDLRLEDREVLKFLAETNGEAFATEIRDRFDMPRSSAWRLIRRLVSLEILEEVKVGNQSLVKIRENYLQ